MTNDPNCDPNVHRNPQTEKGLIENETHQDQYLDQILCLTLKGGGFLPGSRFLLITFEVIKVHIRNLVTFLKEKFNVE